MNLLRLVDKLTNGMNLVVNDVATRIVFDPGLLLGGVITHDCDKERGIGYYLEFLFMLAPFCKKGLKVTLRGVTNNEVSIKKPSSSGPDSELHENSSGVGSRSDGFGVFLPIGVVLCLRDYKIEKRGTEPRKSTGFAALSLNECVCHLERSLRGCVQIRRHSNFKKIHFVGR